MKWFRTLFLVPVAGLIVLASALPAMAQSSPVTVNATVAQSITITGLTATINFPSGVAGTTQTVTGAELYSVSTNDTLGYTLNIVPGAASMADGGPATIANSALSVTETGPGGTAGSHAGQSFNGSNPMLIDSTSTQGSQNYAENWSIAIPNVPAGNYTEQFSYVASAN